MIATVLSTIGSAATIYFLVEPPLAASRLSAQTQADTVVETIRTVALNGNYIRAVNVNGTNVARAYRTNPDKAGFDPTKYTDISIPSNCKILTIFDNVPGVYVYCSGYGSETDRKNDAFRNGISVLVGASPCDSDLFPLVDVNIEATSLCKEIENPPPRLVGGHFDLDSYSGYDNKGLHTHMWSDDYGSSFELIGNSFDDVLQGKPKSVNTYISNKNQKFIIGVVNGSLSPGVRLKINNTTECSAADYNKGCNQSYGPPTIYSLNSGVLGATQLTSLNVSVDYDAIIGGKIIPTSTGFVNTSSSLPGKFGEYRNGALVLQFIAVDSCNSSECTYNGKTIPFYKMGTSQIMSTATSATKSYTSNGGSGVVLDNSVLHEVSIFWHAPGAVWNNTNPYIPNNPSTVSCFIKKQFPSLVPNAKC